ncbi:MAG: DJ-1/PfpI family protein [Rhodothermaceae bacterium]
MKVYLYVLDTLADWEIGYILPELNTGRYFSDKNKRVEIIKISNSLEVIKTMGGIEIHPDKLISEIKFEKDDILILPGSNIWMEPQNSEIITTAKNLLENNIKVCAICGATSALAEAGILDTRKHTSNDKDYLEMFCNNYKGSENYINAPAVVCENLITAGGLASLEFSFEVLKSTNLFDLKVLESWYNLHKTREPKYYFELMNCLS